LARNPVINEHNKATIVETLRNIAEHVVWGDQNDPLLFEYFLEKNILSFMLSIVSPASVGGDVKIQLIQTLSMMIENIKTPSSLCKFL
jgi:protein CLEC16A